MYIHSKILFTLFQNMCTHRVYHKQLLGTLQEIGFIYSINYEKNRFTSTLSIVITVVLYDNCNRDLREFLTHQ